LQAAHAQSVTTHSPWIIALLLLGCSQLVDFNTGRLMLPLLALFVSYQCCKRLCFAGGGLQRAGGCVLLFGGLLALFSLQLAVSQWLLVLTPLPSKYHLLCALAWGLVTAGSVLVRQTASWSAYWRQLTAGVIVGAFAMGFIVLSLLSVQYWFTR